MNQNRRDDPLVEALRALPRVEANPHHAKVLRDRCRSRLAQPLKTGTTPLEPATIGAVCALYAWEIVRSVIVR